MKLLIITFACLLLLSSYRLRYFGVGSAKLECKSQSGRTLFNAELEECQFLETAELSIDNTKENFSKEDDGYIIADLDNKILTMYLESQKRHSFLKFWAIPSSFKTILNEKGPGTQFHKIIEFKAKLYGTEPRQDKEFNTPEIELFCKLDYQL
jgi:hypothetical protein